MALSFCCISKGNSVHAKTAASTFPEYFSISFAKMRRKSSVKMPGLYGPTGVTPWGETGRRTAAKHDCTLICNLSVRLGRVCVQLTNADHAGWDIHPLGCRQRVLGLFTEDFIAMI